MNDLREALIAQIDIWNFMEGIDSIDRHHIVKRLLELLAAHPDTSGTTKRPTVTPQHILDQRTAGWPDMHPEDFCHICGTQNMSWAATRADWLAATTPWAEATGREGICCPQCFAEMYTENTGTKKTWMLIDSATFDALLGGAS